MFSSFKEWIWNRRHRALMVAIGLLASACSAHVKPPSVKSKVASAAVQKVDYEGKLAAIEGSKLEELLYGQLYGLNSKSEIERITNELKSNTQKRERLAKLLFELYTLDEKFNLADRDKSFKMVVLLAEEQASYNYFYGEFGKGKFLLDVTKRGLAKLEREFALLNEIEALIGGKLDWMEALRKGGRGTYSSDNFRILRLKKMFQEFERVLVAEFKSNGDKKFIQALQDLRMLVRKLHKLFVETDVAFPKTQEFLQNLTINLGGTIEELSGK